MLQLPKYLSYTTTEQPACGKSAKNYAMLKMTPPTAWGRPRMRQSLSAVNDEYVTMSKCKGLTLTRRALEEDGLYCFVPFLINGCQPCIYLAVISNFPERRKQISFWQGSLNRITVFCLRAFAACKPVFLVFTAPSQPGSRGWGFPVGATAEMIMVRVDLCRVGLMPSREMLSGRCLQEMLQPPVLPPSLLLSRSAPVVPVGILPACWARLCSC